MNGMQEEARSLLEGIEQLNGPPIAPKPGSPAATDDCALEGFALSMAVSLHHMVAVDVLRAAVTPLTADEIHPTPPVTPYVLCRAALEAAGKAC